MKGQSREPLVADNLAGLHRVIKGGGKLEVYSGVLALLADAADTAIGGAECYITFGLSRNRDQIMLTVHLGREVLYANGGSLLEVSKACNDLL